ncbi:MAG: HEAT repeat domain-containing protein [Candidatus Helarchaeota archaeon]|nr:HEAT repeat domain-containing protein [Candidatus Helarchaeota archaeon]
MLSPEEEEFREMQEELTDEDPNMRGMAAVDLGAFAIEHPRFKERCVVLLQRALNDLDPDVRSSAQKSLQEIEGKPIVESGGQIIAFGYMPKEHQEERPEIDQKQMIISCICCITLIVTVVMMFILYF